jgi:hypothetical protein
VIVRSFSWYISRSAWSFSVVFYWSFPSLYLYALFSRPLSKLSSMCPLSVRRGSASWRFLMHWFVWCSAGTVIIFSVMGGVRYWGVSANGSLLCKRGKCFFLLILRLNGWMKCEIVKMYRLFTCFRLLTFLVHLLWRYGPLTTLSRTTGWEPLCLRGIWYCVYKEESGFKRSSGNTLASLKDQRL